MPLQLGSRRGDLLIRLAGLVTMPVGAASIFALYRLVHTGPEHSATLVEAVLATIGFLCLSLGSMLVVLGGHLFEEVEVSARWAPQTQVRPSIAGDGLPGHAFPMPLAEQVRVQPPQRLRESIEA